MSKKIKKMLKYFKDRHEKINKYFIMYDGEGMCTKWEDSVIPVQEIYQYLESLKEDVPEPPKKPTPPSTRKINDR